MKRGATDHPKLLALCSILNLQKFEAVGLLEMIWHFTAKYTPQGNIGKFSDAAIAKAVGWKRPSGARGVAPECRLSAALVEAGWLDSDTVHRLIVHDWKDHADQAVKKFLSSHSMEFVHLQDSLPEPLPLPEPEPEPEPEKNPFAHLPMSEVDQAKWLKSHGWISVKKASAELLAEISDLRERDFVPSNETNSLYMIWARLNWFDEFWMDYWRHAERKAALVAYFQAVPTLALHERIVAAVQAQTPAMLKREEKHRPHASTWIHGERWNDVPEGELFSDSSVAS